ncbi:MAG: sulfatase, partial [Planctomycetota bacterium JB042]
MSLGERLGFAAVAACGLAAARAALVALADGYLGAGLTDVALESFARTLVRGLPGPALGAAALALLVGRTRLLTALALAAGAALAYAFVTGRLPALPVHAPGFDSARARLAHAGAAATAIAVAVGFVVRIRPRALARLLPAAALLAAAGAAAVGFTPRERPAPVSERPNVILLSIDTLRADRLGCYGYDGGTTPALDAFAAGGVRFDRAYSPQPWTLTSHMTMLTGLSPSVHGLDRDTRLSYGVTPLALRFQRAGYATAAVVDKVAWLEPKYGFARGFHLYRRLGGQATRKTAAAEALLDDLADRPFFLFLHVFDVHSDWGKLPYDADPEDVERFAGWYDGPFDGCEGDVCASKLLQKLVEEGRSLPPEEARYVSSLYDAGLRSLDRRLAPFLARLEEDGRLDDTFVFVTSDHGEELFEHGSCLHGAFHDEVMRVPLLVRGPGVRSGASVEPAVGHVDFAPTFE